MKNFIQKGYSLDLIAPAGGVVSGLGYVIGQLIVFAQATKAAGETFAGSRHLEMVFLRRAVCAPSQLYRLPSGIHFPDHFISLGFYPRIEMNTIQFLIFVTLASKIAPDFRL